MSRNQDFVEVGYSSARQRFVVEYARWLGRGTVLIFGLLVYIFLRALDKETLEMFAMVFFSIILGLLGLGGSLAIVIIYKYIRQPGRQLPGELGEWEGRLGMD
jgi:hypothetical protein